MNRPFRNWKEKVMDARKNGKVIITAGCFSYKVSPARVLQKLIADPSSKKLSERQLNALFLLIQKECSVPELSCDGRKLGERELHAIESIIPLYETDDGKIGISLQE